jgi:zinc protease
VVLSHQTGVRIPVALPFLRRRAARPLALALLTAASLLAATAAFAQPRETSSPHAKSSKGLPSNVERVDSLAGIIQYRLRSNGMNIYLSPNHAAPVVTFLVVYHVGSRNEAPGNTGSAHLLEHMLFNKSTKNFGKANKKETFQEVLYAAGADAGTTNMTTWNDRMTGYSTLPADKLELAMRIESDRISRALILDSERQPEMSVVRNEYDIGENSPYGALEKAIVAAAIVAHPYHWDTIGYRSDIEGVTTEKLREHYHTYFWPDNAEAVLVGDFDTDEALRLFDREFGKLPRSKSPIPKVITVEPPQEGERRVVVKRPGEVGIVQIGYIRPGALDHDFIALDLVQTILSIGVNSKLYQALVETKLATDIDASNYTFRDPFPFMVQATVAPGVTHEKVEATMKKVLADLAANGVTDAELNRAKSQTEVAVVRQRDGTYQFASALGEAVASASWKWFATYLDSMNTVSAADIKRVAAKYFIPDHATVGWFVPISKNPSRAIAPPAAKTPAKSKKAGAGGAIDPVEASSRFSERTLHRVLPNGIVLDVVANHAVPTVALFGVALAGKQEAPGSAVPQLTAMMLSRGTRSHDKKILSQALENAGAQLTINGDLSEATVAGSALSRDTKLLLGTLAEELREPAFPKDELVKAKSELRANLLRGYDNTGLRAREALSRLAYPEGHPFRAVDREVMLGSLDRATSDDLRVFHHDRWVGSGIILCVVGDVDTAQVATWVTELFGGIPRGTRPTYNIPRVEPNAASRTLESMPGKANVDFVLGHASGIRRMDPDWEAAIIANAALGGSSVASRLANRVRDTEGLSYFLYSRLFWSDYLDGVWAVDVAVAPQNTAHAIRSTREVMEKYAKEGITDAEVETQKSFFAGNYRVRLSTNAGIAFSLAYAEKYGYGPRYLDEFPELVAAVTRDQVNKVIREKLHPEKMHLVVAGDFD